MLKIEGNPSITKEYVLALRHNKIQTAIVICNFLDTMFSVLEGMRVICLLDKIAFRTANADLSPG